MAKFLDILKAFFVRHSSEYETSDSYRKVNRNMYPDKDTRDGVRVIGITTGQLGSINIVYLKGPREKTNYFCLHKSGL